MHRPLTIKQLASGLQRVDGRSQCNVGNVARQHDVRRTALRQLRQAALTHWQSKRDGREYFASRAAIDTGRMVLRHGSAEQQITLVHLATNSLQHHWAPLPSPPAAAAAAAHARRDTVQQLTCADCSAIDADTIILTPAHLSTCPHAIGEDYRAELCRNILALLSQHALTADWLQDYRDHTPTLSTLLHRLVTLPPDIAASPPADPERQRHLTYAMCGMLTTSQLTAAARRVGFDDVLHLPQGIRLMQRVCLLCIDQLGRMFKPP